MPMPISTTTSFANELRDFQESRKGILEDYEKGNLNYGYALKQNCYY